MGHRKGDVQGGRVKLKYDNVKEKIWRDAGFDVATPQECADDFDEDVIDDYGIVYHPRKRHTDES